MPIRENINIFKLRFDEGRFFAPFFCQSNIDKNNQNNYKKLSKRKGEKKLGSLHSKYNAGFPGFALLDFS